MDKFISMTNWQQSKKGQVNNHLNFLLEEKHLKKKQEIRYKMSI